MGDGQSGVLSSANYAQKTYNNEFSDVGKQIYSKKAGVTINTVDDLSDSIRNGKISISDLPIDYIVRDNNILILNTRTSQALTKAGIPRYKWIGINRTGDELFEAMLTNQLRNNKLDSTGIDSVRQGGN